jgi:hypothetical protein
MAGHSRSKNGVASLAYARPSTTLFRDEDADARPKAGHDDFEARYFAGSLGDQSLIGEVFS